MGGKIKMKLWIDDVRPAPDNDYLWAVSVNHAIEIIKASERFIQTIELIDIDHDDAVITAAQAVKDIKPGWEPDRYNTFWGRNRHR